MMCFTIHEVLGDNGLLALNQLLDTSLLEDYYLAGGTGLALYLKHRRSFDLDFFCREMEPSSFKHLEDLGRSSLESTKIRLKSKTELTMEIHGFTITFLHFPFPLLYPLKRGEALSPFLQDLYLASPEEILLMKAYALGRRASYRDYMDLYIGLSRGVITLKEILLEAKKKFVLKGEALFSPKLFLEQLVYTDDIEDKEIALEMLASKGITSREIEEYLCGQVHEYLGDSDNLEGRV